jgi:hypothetical protein
VSFDDVDGICQKLFLVTLDKIFADVAKYFAMCIRMDEKNELLECKIYEKWYL